MNDYENQLLQKLEEINKHLAVIEYDSEKLTEQNKEIIDHQKNIQFNTSFIGIVVFFYALWQIIKLLIANGVINSIF